jgi:hypothetical protein
MTVDENFTAHEPVGDTSHQVGPEPPILPHEYAFARINIVKTLGSAFLQHASEKTPGTFVIDSEESFCKFRDMLYEFISSLRLPKATDPEVGASAWECPRFLPRQHLVFVRKVYQDGTRAIRAELDAVKIERAHSTASVAQGVKSESNLEYVAIHPTPSPRSDYPALVTEPCISRNLFLYQDLYATQWCRVGTAFGDDRVYLSEESSKVLDELGRVIEQAKKAPGSEIVPSRNCPSPCGCKERHPHAKQVTFLALDDIVVDFHRGMDRLKDVDVNGDQLSFGQEGERVLELADVWIMWLVRRATKRPNRLNSNPLPQTQT